MSEWTGFNKEEDEKWEELWNKYVPADGKADTVGGEIMRAISRLVYRWNNDGDTCNEGEYLGSNYNHCQGANLYLLDQNIPGYVDLRGIYGKIEYDDTVKEVLMVIFKYLLAHPELFEKPNKEDDLELSPYEEDEDDEWDDEYDENDDDWGGDDWEEENEELT